MSRLHFLLSWCAVIGIVFFILYYRQLPVNSEIIRADALRTSVEENLPSGGNTGRLTLVKEVNSDNYIISFSDGGPNVFYCILSCDNGGLSKTRLYCHESCTYETDHYTANYLNAVEEDNRLQVQPDASIIDRIVVYYYDKDDQMISSQILTVYETYEGELCMTN